MNQPLDPFMADLLKRMEARAAVAAKKPTQARNFQSEAEIEAALARMEPIAADAVRFLADTGFRERDAIQTEEQFNHAYHTAICRAIEADQVRERGSSYGVSMHMLMEFEADHSLEVRRVTEAVLIYRLRGMTPKGHGQGATGCVILVAAVSTLGSAAGVAASWLLL